MKKKRKSDSLKGKSIAWIKRNYFYTNYFPVEGKNDVPEFMFLITFTKLQMSFSSNFFSASLKDILK